MVYLKKQKLVHTGKEIFYSRLIFIAIHHNFIFINSSSYACKERITQKI